MTAKSRLRGRSALGGNETGPAGCWVRFLLSFLALRFYLWPFQTRVTRLYQDPLQQSKIVSTISRPGQIFLQFLTCLATATVKEWQLVREN